MSACAIALDSAARPDLLLLKGDPTRSLFFAIPPGIKMPAQRRAVVFIIKVIGPTGGTADAKRVVYCCCIRPRAFSSSRRLYNRVPSVKLAQSLKKKKLLSSFIRKKTFTAPHI
ncbi:MAG: hypothetical protein ACKN9T_11335 [Candidatus Methylumidiphilus sp.]